MTVLRSREIISVPPKPSPKSPKNGFFMEPLTPAKAVEASYLSYSNSPTPSPMTHPKSGSGSDSGVLLGETTVRRSSRLASKSSSGECLLGNVVSTRKRKIIHIANESNQMEGSGGFGETEVGFDKSGPGLGKRVSSVKNKNGNVSDGVEVSESGEDMVCVNLRFGKRIFKGGVNGKVEGVCVIGVENGNGDKLVYEDGMEGKVGESVAGLKNVGDLASLDSKEVGNGSKGDEVFASGSDGRRRSSRLQKGKEKAVEANSSSTIGINAALETVVKVEESVEDIVSGDCVLEEMETDGSAGRSNRRLSREEKGKGKAVEIDISSSRVVKVEESVENTVYGDYLLEEMETDGSASMSKRRLSREEKGKDKAVEVDISSSRVANMGLDLERNVEKLNGSGISGPASVAGDVAGRNERQVVENSATGDTTRTRHMNRFRDIARRNASRFAHFPSQEEEENQVDEVEREMPQRELKEEAEDWPGPFSTAMRIIKDRETKVDAPQNSLLDESGLAHVKWVPKKDGQNRLKLVAPSLQELSMQFLAKNADAITSLESVPDALRHKLSQLLCDTRGMNAHFLDLLASGTPTEIRVKDCSWLSEEQFTKTFEGSDLTKLTVLQLDQCGRCLPDYTMFSTLARSSNHLPALTTISVKGGCRLSDSGLRALVSSAPNLRSINLSQCSLLTADALDTLASKLGSVLKELYLDDCESIGPMLILPALSRLKHLEVLSLAGIQTVCDDFISQFVSACGQNLKELSLANCTKLTDSSLKVIAENCFELCSIDLTNLRKLTDSAIGYLAGCQAIQTLKLCRNAFSDEAVAAYLEACGESLKELSLNNVKVAQNTAISLAKRSRNLLSLDLSWCRNLTNEAVGLIVDSCLSLKVLKLFGCTQITSVFIDGHSNPQVQIIGMKFSQLLKHIEVPELVGPLHYSSA